MGSDPIDIPPETPGVYAAHRKIYPRSIQGRFRRLKWGAMACLLGLFWGGPWLRWDRGLGVPDQALFLDLPGRRAYLFALELWPQEVYYLTGLLIFASVLLFFTTALAGRLWCGFACFQTVFTDLFVWIERKIEGERPRRMALDAAPWGFGKIARKALKTGLWALVSGAVGIGFTLYFFPEPVSALAEILSGRSGVWPYTSIAVVGGFCFLLAGYAREQVCIYMCPYGRFQGAMTDEHSRLVTYAAWRGEPRAPYRRDADFSHRGHCVDCGLCVQVCPTGVDIRAGNQLACIGCGLCIDACDQVMHRYGLPPGLVSLDSVARQTALAAGRPVRRTLRLRPLIYAGVLFLIGAAFVWSVTTRPRLDVTVLHERSPLFVLLGDGSIRNAYTLKILNMERRETTFRLDVEGPPGAHLTGADPTTNTLTVGPARQTSFRLFVTVPRAALARGEDSTVTLRLTQTQTGQRIDVSSLFAGPS